MAETIWSTTIYERFRAAGIALVAHVPDNVVAPIIRCFEADASVTTVSCTREEEGVGIVAGGLVGGTRGALLMQTSGFGNCLNALGSLVLPYQLPLIMVISGRGELQEFNPAQRPIGRGIRRILDALDIQHHTLDNPETLARTLDFALTTAYLTSAPIAFIVSPLLSQTTLPVNPSVRSSQRSAASSQ